MVFALSHISSSHSILSHRSAITANNKHVSVGMGCIMQMRPVPTGTVFSASFHLMVRALSFPPSFPLLVVIFGCSIPNGIVTSYA